MADLYTKDDVRAWGSLGGAVFYAPKGTSLPEDHEEALDPAFLPVGILSEDGVSEAVSVEVNKIKGWPGGQTVRISNTGTEKTVAFTMLENSPLAAKLYYGSDDPVVAGTGARIDIDAAIGIVEGAFVIEKHDGDTVERRCIDLAQVSERGEMTANNEDVSGKEVTLDVIGDVDYIVTNAASFVDALTP